LPPPHYGRHPIANRTRASARGNAGAAILSPLTLEARDTLFRSTAARPGDFRFDERTAEVFDDMLRRSIPFYREQQGMIAELGGRFWVPGTDAYDLGCSTGTTLVNLARELPEPATVVGYDNSLPMLDRAAAKVAESGLEERIELRFGDLGEDLSRLPLEHASVVTLCWTLQFIPPLRRDSLIRWIYRGLVEDGTLLVTEKILTESSPMNRFFTELYHEFKRRNGYSAGEIARKREALENVLVPYRTEENLEMFRRAGFEIVETFFQWCNFAGYICVKKPAASPGPRR
jgi:tRNA (cmo5U34)-methyltransferase